MWILQAIQKGSTVYAKSDKCTKIMQMIRHIIMSLSDYNPLSRIALMTLEIRRSACERFDRGWTNVGVATCRAYSITLIDDAII